MKARAALWSLDSAKEMPVWDWRSFVALFVDIFAVVTAVGAGSSSPAEGAMTLA